MHDVALQYGVRTMPVLIQHGVMPILIVLAGSLAAQVPVIDTVLNAASHQSGVVAGSLIVISGANFSGSQIEASEPLPLTLAGVSVLVAGQPVPIRSAGPGRIVAQLPWNLIGRSEASFIVVAERRVSATKSIALTNFAPAIFTVDGSSSGEGMIVPSGSGGPPQPLRAGDEVDILCTGLGPLLNAPPAGVPAPRIPAPGASTASPAFPRQPSVMIGDVPAAVTWAGLAPGRAGVYLVRVRIPSNAPVGDPVQVRIRIGGVTSSPVSVAVAQTSGIAVQLRVDSAEITPGGNLQIRAQVTGSEQTGLVWKVTGLDGATPSSGTYFEATGSDLAVLRASSGGADEGFLVQAVSTADAKRYAAVRIQLRPPPGKPAVRIVPESPVVPFGESIQFRALLPDGSNAAVQWYEADSNGVFTSAAYQVDTRIVSAVLSSDVTVRAFTTAYIVPAAPTFEKINTSEGAIGDELILSGSYLNSASVYFPGVSGISIHVRPDLLYPDEVRVRVPPGAASGQISVEAGPYRIYGIPFTRIPALRLRAQKNRLSVGESTHLSVAFLGENRRLPVLWSAQKGSITQEGAYTAPSVPADGFDSITACIAGRICDTVVVAIQPFVIEPDWPLVSTGNRLRLTAASAGRSVAAVWEQSAGGGMLSGAGEYTAPTGVEDGGSVPVRATSAGAVQKTSIGVTGLFPGQVSALRDHVDFSANTPRGTYVERVAIWAQRAFVASCDVEFVRVNRYCWIDIYDIRDPSQPVWLDAVEDLRFFRAFPLLAHNGFLYRWDEGRLVVYDVRADRLSVADVISPEGWRGLLYPPSFHEGRFYSVVVDHTNPAEAVVRMLDVTAGRAAETQWKLTLPSGPDIFSERAIGTGNLLFVSASTRPRPETPFDPIRYFVAAYDISSTEPRLLGTAEYTQGFNARFAIIGNLLTAGADVFDIANGQPLRIAGLPGNSVQHVSGLRVLVGGSQMSTHVVDLSQGDRPRLLASPASAAGWLGAAIAGNYVLSAEGFGGLVVYSFEAPGGPVHKGIFGRVFRTAYGLAVKPPYLFAAIAGSPGGVHVFDLSVQPPALVATADMPGAPGAGSATLAVELYNDHLFVGDEDAFRVLDISDPRSPKTVLTIPDPVIAMTRVGNYLYVVTPRVLLTLNVLIPWRPNVVSEQLLPGQPASLSIGSGLLLVAMGDEGVLIFSIATPPEPALLSQVRLATPAADVVTDGRYAYVAADNGGLVVLDLGDPARPVVRSRTLLKPFPFSSPWVRDFAWSIRARDGIVFVGTGLAGKIYGFDCRRPEQPRLVSLDAYGGDEIENNAVYAIAFHETELIAGGWLQRSPLARSDVAKPRNVIQSEFVELETESATPARPVPVTADKARPWSHPKLRKGAATRSVMQ